MGSKRYLSPREILGDRRRDRHLTAAEILSDELEDDPENHTPTAQPGTSGSGSGGDRSDRGEVTVKRRETPGTDWQWLDDERVESRSD